LRHLGVPVRLEGGEDALLVRPVQQFLTLLECIHDVRRDDLLAEVLHFEWLKLPVIDVLKVLRYAGVERHSLWAVVADEKHLGAAGVGDPSVWQNLVERLARWRARQHNTSLQAFLSEVMQEAGLLEYMLAPTTGPGVLQAMRRLLDEAKALNETEHSLSLGDFLQSVRRVEQHRVALMTRPYQVSENAVRIMTAHKAKGLEFPHVFLLRLCDKHWGNNPSPERISLPAGLIRHDMVAGAQNNEDERRLFYVALTRAQQSLTLSFARHSEVGRAAVPSLFLHEVPPELVVRHRVGEEFSRGQERLADSIRPAAVTATSDVTAWVRSQLENYTLSVTHLNNYLACPRMFYIRNVLQVPAVRSVYQALGTAVHGALDDFLYRYQQEARVPAPEVLLASFERHLKREVLTAEEARDVRDVGRDILAAYFDKYSATFNPNAVSEFDFRSHGVRVGSAAITGKIDKIEWLDADKKTANVVDYKTGQPDGKAAALKPGGEYHRQLVFYKLLCDGSPRFPHEMVSGEIDFVQPSRKGTFIKERIVVTEADTKELTETIERVWQEIKGLRFLDPAAWCGECEYCAY
jgi:DNA helicase II / ATP-dependent DNA helicase PcrA